MSNVFPPIAMPSPLSYSNVFPPIVVSSPSPSSNVFPTPKKTNKLIVGTTFRFKGKPYSIPDGYYTEQQIVNALSNVFSSASPNKVSEMNVYIIKGSLFIDPKKNREEYSIDFGLPPNGAGNLGWSKECFGDARIIRFPALAPFKFLTGEPTDNYRQYTNTQRGGRRRKTRKHTKSMKYRKRRTNTYLKHL